MTFTAKDLAKESGMLSVEEVLLIQKYVKTLPANPVIVNIGAGTGTSVLSVLEVRKDAFVFSVDKNVEPRERDALNRADKLKMNRVWRVLGDSSRVGKYWPYGIDMCFVDGAHHDSAVIADIEAWKPHVLPGGIMFFHDYKHPNIPSMVPIVDSMMDDWTRLGEARYLVVFANK